jgi:hypothetical protein
MQQGGGAMYPPHYAPQYGQTPQQEQYMQQQHGYPQQALPPQYAHQYGQTPPREKLCGPTT